jgi:repressor LexA
MREDLTRKQKRVFDFIVRTIQDRGYPPTIREIGEEFSISSTNGVRDHLKALVKKGYIKRSPHTSRGIELNEYVPRNLPAVGGIRVPVLGSVAAGQPILAVENIDTFITLDKLLVKSEGTFALKVKGDSMINAGILDGDYVLVRQQPTAERGEIVAVIIDDEATVKRYYPEDGYVRLQPENDSMEPIIVERGRGEFRVVGRVVGVVRMME